LDIQDDVTIYVGGVHASRRPTTVRTLLGSCIAVCLYDPVAGVGGMNHFLLPEARGSEDQGSLRFGVHAMDHLIGELMGKCGADRRRLQAKVFGGAHVVDMKEHEQSVPARNVRFIQEFLREERLQVVSQDLGGSQARLVVFQTHDGRARVKRLESPAAIARLRARQVEAPPPPPTFGEITLF
jgi:chemotaxis receptor (MCP) glutamine deamidase CheD